MTKFLRTAFAAAIFMIAIGAAGSIEANGQVLNSILDRMNEHNKALSSLRANVTMSKVNTQLGGVTDTTEGKVQYLTQKKAEPFVRIDWVRPVESLAVMRGQYVLYRPNLKQYVTGTTKSAKGNAKGGSALAFINMSRAELRANYDAEYLGEATVKGGIKTWHIKLTPKTAQSYKWAEIWVDVNGMPIQTTVVEKNDDRTTIYLSNLEKNVKIEGSAFKITIPKDAKKVEA